MTSLWPTFEMCSVCLRWDGGLCLPHSTCCFGFFTSEVSYSSPSCSCHRSLLGEILYIEIIALTAAKISWCY